MDKRTIIGIVLIAVILILTPLYQKWVVGTLPQQEGTDTLSVGEHKITSPEKDTIAATRLESSDTADLEPDTMISATGKVTPKVSSKKIYVHTDKFDVILSTAGGDIVSAKLRGIYDDSGKRVNMFPRPLGGPNCEWTLIADDKVISTTGINFVMDKDSIVIDEDNRRDAVTLAGILPDGSMIQRRYEFEYGTYNIRQKILVVAEDSGKVFDEGILWLKSGLLPSEKNIGWDIRELAAYYKIGEEVDKVKPSRKKPSTAIDGATDWIGITSKYFTNILLPDNLLGASGIRTNTYWFTDTISHKDIPLVQVGLYHRIGENKFSKSYLIYSGPRDYFILKHYGRKLDKIVDLGWWWLSPITKLLLNFLKILYKVVPNYGWVIIIFTFLMKLLLLPVAHTQMKSMKKMKKIQPLMRSIQERYRDEPQKLNVELMKLYKKHGVSPLSGCLPLLAQMPIFFALYRALSSGFQFRAQPFIFWIKDLSQRDPYFVLPIVMAITMFVQQKISITDPKQKMMAYIMPVVFLFFFYRLPAGLVLYWTVFNMLSVVHMLWVEHKWVESDEIPAEAVVEQEPEK